jgi:hypothetical protein
LQEFWFTAVAAFLYFTAFVAMLAEFGGTEDDEYQYWIDAQVTAGVSDLHTKLFTCTKPIGEYRLS